jgi:hypothetical protein
MPAKPVTPAEFRAIVRWKGWRHKDLAEYWDISAVHVSRIVNDPQRAVHWNDAVMGLPRSGRVLSDLANRQARAASLVRPMDVPRPGVRRGRPPQRRPQQVGVPQSGYRHRGYVVVGSILTLDRDLGDSLHEGERGIVYAVEDTGVGERFGVIFESGESDWFLPLHLDSGLTSTGLDAEGLSDYRFESKVLLEADFNRGVFRFW